MTKIIYMDRELAGLNVETLVAEGLYLLFSSEFDRFERKLSDLERLSIASSLDALRNPFVWLSIARSETVSSTLKAAIETIDRQMKAESAEPLPAYDVHPAALHLSSIFDELVRRKDENLERARRRMPPEMLREYEAA